MTDGSVGRPDNSFSSPSSSDIAGGAPANSTAGTIGISLLVFEAAPWVRMLLSNICSFTAQSTVVALHANAGVNYSQLVLRDWESPRVSVNPERIIVGRAQGSILWAHVLNAVHLGTRWPACSHVVLQASNMMWLRPGMEVRVLDRSYSLSSHFPAPSTETKRHFRSALYRELTSGGRYPFAYHEGSFYPLPAVVAFRDFVLSWVASNRTSLDRTLLRVGSYPEEAWLQAFVANHYPPFLAAISSKSYKSSRQLCWRLQSHAMHTSPVVMETVGCGRMPWLYASKLVRGLADNVSRVVGVISSRAFSSTPACNATASGAATLATKGSELPRRWEPDASLSSFEHLQRLDEWCQRFWRPSGTRVSTRYSRFYEECS